MLVMIIVVALLVLVALALLALVFRRRGARTRARREEEIRADLRESPGGSDNGRHAQQSPTTSATPAGGGTTDPWTGVDDVAPGQPDPAGPPAAIHMAVTGTDPWQAVRTFLHELTTEGYLTTVEAPDLVVLRDDEQQPVTVREPCGPPGQIIVTSPPERLSSTLEVLVRSLLADAFTVEGTDGCVVDLADENDVAIRLRVSELTPV